MVGVGHSGPALLTLLAVSCAKGEQTATAPAAAASQDATRDSHLSLGNPSGAVTNATYYANYLLSKAQFSVSHH